MQSRWSWGLLTVLAALFAAPSARASAGFAPLLVEVDAFDSAGRTGSFVLFLPSGTLNTSDQSISLNYTTVTNIVDSSSGQLIAILRRVGVYARVYQPKITIDFIADAADAEVTFLVTSPWIGFPLISQDTAQMKAYATFTAKDQNFDGARLVSIGQPGSGAFRAFANGLALNGAPVTQLVNEVAVSAGGTVSGWQYDPPQGTRPVRLNMNDASVMLAFSISAYDRATCNGRFELFGPTNPRGDLNCDGRVTLFDIDAFTLALFTPGVYSALFPNCNIMNADCNGDGVVNNFDLDAFVDLVTGAGPSL